ncbi:MAG TPA: endonuclease [Nannocystaceae bacterium]|nr:endonuclease [Nannocystaceae bacterium]
MADLGRFVVVVALCCACGGSSADGGVAKEEKGKGAGKASKPEAKANPQPPKDPEPLPSKPLPTMPASLDDAEAAAAQVYADHRVTFYCGCSYTTDMRNIRQSCGYRTRADDTLAHQITWTHVVPARAFGAHRACWTTEACKRDDGSSFGGIECCRQRDPVFSRMETDLHNLVPEIAEVDKDRSDYALGTVKGDARMYGACDIEVDGQAGVFEPPDKLRGDIARIYFYMRDTYGEELKVTPDQWTLLQQWSTEDPLDEWETKRAEKIAAVLAAPPQPKAPPAEGKAPADAKAPDAKAPADAKAPDAKAPGDAKAPKGKGA